MLVLKTMARVLLPAGFLFLWPVPAATQSVTAFFSDRSKFNLAAGFPPVIVGFDGIAAGTTITGTTISGVTFDREPGSPQNAQLIVVRGSDTFTPAGFTGVVDGTKNRLVPTTGANVLSPGGLELAPGPSVLQKDGLLLTFASPVAAVGFDILFQQLDCCSFVRITVLNEEGEVLFARSPIPTPSSVSAGPGGAVFVGFVSESTDIKQIVVTDLDDDNVFPDANLGYDSLRFVPNRPSRMALGPASIQAVINGVPFTATLDGEWDLFEGGGMVGRVTAKFSNLPPNYHPAASSGLSWLSWSNTCSPAPPAPQPTPTPSPTPKPKPTSLQDCNSLHGWNYTLERRNVFPDGNSIIMHFDVRRRGPNRIAMTGQWRGRYQLGTDIVFVEQPLIEHLTSDGPGRIRGFYRYVLVFSDGRRVPVNTFSTYTFDPLVGSDGLLDTPQKRTTTNAWFFDHTELELTVVGQSAMLPEAER